MSEIHIRNRKKANGKSSWEYYFFYNGKRYSKGGFTTKTIAKKEGNEKYAFESSLFEAEQKKIASKGISDDITLREAIDQFYEVNSHKFKYSTLHKMKLLEPELESLMDCRLSELNYKTLQNYFNNRKHRGFETNRVIYKALNRYFECCIQCDQMTKNPLKYVAVQGTKFKSPEKVITNDNFADLIHALEEKISETKNANTVFRMKSYRIALYLGYYLGLRIGEVMSLCKEDFNLENGTVKIHKTLVYMNLKVNEIFIQESPKTETSIADQVIPDVFIPVLKEWFDENPHEYVISDLKGNLIHPDCMSNLLRTLSKEKCMFPFHFHQLRHLYASNLYAGNVDIKAAQELLRHKDVSTTLGVYTHLSQETKADKLNAVFSSF